MCLFTLVAIVQVLALTSEWAISTHHVEQRGLPWLVVFSQYNPRENGVVE